MFRAGKQKDNSSGSRGGPISGVGHNQDQEGQQAFKSGAPITFEEGFPQDGKDCC